MEQERRGFQIVVSSGQRDTHGPASATRFGRVKALLIALFVASLFIGFFIAALLLGSILAVVFVVLAGVATAVALFKAAVRSARRHPRLKGDRGDLS